MMPLSTHRVVILVTTYLFVICCILPAKKWVDCFVPSSATTTVSRSSRLFSVNGNVGKQGVGGEEEEDAELVDVVINGMPTEAETTTSIDQPYFNGYSMTSGYSPFLDKNDKTNRNRDDLDEDGYADMMKRGSQRSFWKKVIKFPVKAVKYILTRGATKEPGTLILVRHGGA